MPLSIFSTRGRPVFMSERSEESADASLHPGIHELAGLLRSSAPWLALTGAGCSTASGLAAYRDANGCWMHSAPITLEEFVGSESARRRYWFRSYRGWPVVHRAQPNPAHLALAQLECAGLLGAVITQNVDGLHDKAGSLNVIDLHGRLDRVRCMSCNTVSERSVLQRRLSASNPAWSQEAAVASVSAPDGDARFLPHGPVQLVACEGCGGVLKPDVVFFGETVPKGRVCAAYHQLERAGGLLVAGSSLMVFSGYRFVKRAVSLGLPIAVVNRGQTRADGVARLKLDGDCGQILTDLATAVSSN